MEQQQSRVLQTFSVGSDLFAVWTDEVMTFAEWREPAVLPQAPASVLGVVSIQGRMLTVLNLSQLLEQQHAGPRSHILALNGDDQLALAIDAPGETIELGDIKIPAENNLKLIDGVISRNGREIKILDLKELFPAALQGRERRRRRF